MVVGAIFAGGYGKRLKPLTDKIPKPLIPIRKNYTILDKLLLDYKYAGIKDVYLLVGYKYKKIKERFGNEWKGLKLHYFIERKPMGTLWALRNFTNHVNDDVILRNGDTVSDFNLLELKNFAENSDSMLFIALTRMRSPYAIVEFSGQKIIGFVEKPLLDLYINAGLYYIKKESYKYLNEEYLEKEIEKTFFPKLVNLGLASPYIENVTWIPVDNFKDLEELKKEYKGRTDKEFGYTKKKENQIIYYVKKNYSVLIKDIGRMNITMGKGIINNETIVERGFIYELKNNIFFKALENSYILIEK